MSTENKKEFFGVRRGTEMVWLTAEVIKVTRIKRKVPWFMKYKFIPAINREDDTYTVTYRLDDYEHEHTEPTSNTVYTALRVLGY